RYDNAKRFQLDVFRRRRIAMSVRLCESLSPEFLKPGGTAVRLSLLLASTVVGLIASASAQADDLKIALLYGKTGPLEAYATPTETGIRLGLEYATKGTMTLDGRKI
ncbi:hypothetical protein, partial [Acinetobacter baumannii]|uniref:hypothetical protein n=1 Tax=Acinetobacter baumannii TaxID=470 RepID=UPI001BB466E1